MIATFLDLPRFDSPALCATEGRPDDWHPPSGGEGALIGAKAREVCRRCPSREPCLAYALAHPGLTGLWADTTANERQDMRQGSPSRRRQRTHCANGHPFTAENTQRTERGRRCRTCHNRRSADSKRRAAS